MTDVGVIVWLQSFRTPLLDLVFRSITFLGEEGFYVNAIPIIYWCVDPLFGYRLANVSLFNFWLNSWLKMSFHTPRPASDRIVALVEQHDPSFPSGHAQGTTVFWGFTALYWKRRWLAYLAAAVVFLVSLSRLYLGVHFPVDLLGGAAIGLAILAAAHWVIGRWPQRLRRPLPALAVTLAAGLGMAALHHEPGVAVITGALVGLGAGHILREELVPYSPRASWGRQAAKVGVGVAVVMAVRLGLKAVFPAGFGFEFLRYALVGVAATLALPWGFVKLGLAPLPPGASPPLHRPAALKAPPTAGKVPPVGG